MQTGKKPAEHPKTLKDEHKNKEERYKNQNSKKLSKLLALGEKPRVPGKVWRHREV